MVWTVTEGNRLLDLFTRYHQDPQPVHVLACAMGVTAVTLVLAPAGPRADRDRRSHRGPV
jgi:hypothetical protein